jgi:hypothetical protein
MDMFGLSNLYPTQNTYTAASVSILDTNTLSTSSILGYSIAILIVLLIILLFINYTIYPIFILYPDGPGFIPVPFTKPAYETFWPPQSSAYIVPDLSNCKVNAASLSSGWSMSLDISIMNPTTPYLVGGQPGFRLLFHRGGVINATPSAAITDGSIGSVITGHNVAIGLLKDTNDLLISVSTLNGQQSVLLNNVPTQTPFRIGIVITQNLLEVYFNGKLSKTLTLTSSILPISSTAPYPLFQGPMNGTLQQVARLGNLLIWTQPVPPSILKYATPGLMPSVPGLDTLNAGNPGALCSASDESLLGQLTSDFDADTVQRNLGNLNLTSLTQNPSSR